MEEKTLFTLRAPEIGKAADETQTVVSDGGELLIKIRSRKQKIVNGKVVETTTPSCKVTMGESWLSSRVEVDNQYNILNVYFDIEKNTSSSERIAVITVTQNESGKKLIIHIIQNAGVTYTDYLEVPLQLTVLGNTKGSTLTIKVISYSLGSDGSKVAKSPSVGAAPSWANQVSVGQMTGDHEYPITFTATETNSSNTTRKETALITCGTAQKSVFINQSGQPTKITNNITIRVYKSASYETRGHCVIRSDQPVATDITFKLKIQYGVSSGDQREYTYTLSKDRTLLENLFAIQKEAYPQLIDYSYSPQSDSQYIYDVTVL